MWNIIKAPITSLLASLILGFVAGISTAIKLDVIQGALIGISFFSVLWMGCLIFIPVNKGRHRIRRISLAVVTPIGTLSIGLLGFLETGIGKNVFLILNQSYSFGKLIHFSTFGLILLTCLTIIFVILFVINLVLRDNTAMGSAKNSFDEQFPEREFKNRLESFKRHLINKLDHLDTDANWSDAYFTPLDAEVEVQSKNKRSKKITDLLSAIRRDKKTKVFLVLGDPGSGKSVALRKLCRDLLQEVTKAYKLPIYVNLKEWQVENKWTPETPPSYQQLYDFTINSLMGRDRFADEFIEKYFVRLFENGHLFWIFDSFDEIPAVLDENESSWLIDKLSEILNNFLAGANESRGILSSRFYRRPTLKFQSKTILEIQPFSEYKISLAFKKYVSFDHTLVNILFKERQELIPIAANPFSAGLIYNFVKDRGQLPINQSQLYTNYIEGRLDSSAALLEQKKLTKTQVIDAAIEIANYMFEKPNLGLEASIKELTFQFQGFLIDEIIEVLVYCKIGRIGKGLEERFSFVHRRFNEYFVIQKLVRRPELVRLEAIPTDSKYRDALVLYCEVVNEDEAKRIAWFCWKEIRKLSSRSTRISLSQYQRSVHCLRFLRDAYRSRNNCLSSFAGKLGHLIEIKVGESVDAENLLFAKLSLEVIGLLNFRHREAIVKKALSMRNSWITETSLKAIRYIKWDKTIIERSFIEYFLRMRVTKLLLKKKEILFSLQLIDESYRIQRYLRLLVFDKYAIILCGLLLIFLYPYSATLFSLLFVAMWTLATIIPIGLVKYWHIELFIRIVVFFSVSLFLINVLMESPHTPGSSFQDKINNEGYSWILEPLGTNVFWFFEILLWSLLFPIISGYFSLKFLNSKDNWIRRARLRNVVKKIHLILLIGILTCVIVVFVFYFIKPLGSFALIFATLLSSSPPIIFILIQYLKDLKLLKKTKLETAKVEISRLEIFLVFHSLKTKKGRYKYVSSLASSVRVCYGDWPNGQVPFVKDDEASILLAQLEEKWLGLD